VLGADTPLDEVASAQARARCDGIVLSGSVDPTPAVLEALRSLASGAGVPVLVGGLASSRHEAAIRAAGAHPLGTELHAVLRRLPQLVAAAH